MSKPELAAPSAGPLQHPLAPPGSATPARADGRAAHSILIVPLFAAALFLSAFLLFLVEPMVARMVLPILGGAPMVWNACMVFFQLALLAGYGYAYASARWINVRQHAVVHALLLLVPLTVLPFVIQPDTAHPPQGNPILWLLAVLAGTIGLPFFALSTTASVFQHWFSRTDHPSARDPYFLYAASNLGSLLALAAYPVVVEPLLPLREQSRIWTIGYAEFVALAGACAVFVWRRTARSPVVERVYAAVAPGETDATDAAPSALRRARWITLAFVPSSLMLAVTSYVSTDIAAVPLLWIAPLALYLLTFVIAFSARGESARRIARRTVPLLVVPLALFMIARVRAPLTMIMPLHLLAYALVALQCHAELAHDRPAASRLTEFYFWVSFGGMLGGLFNTVVAPLLFDSIVEYPLVVVLACLLLPELTSRTAASHRRPADVLVPLAVGGLTAGVLIWVQAHGGRLNVMLPALAIPAIVAYGQKRRPVRFGSSIGAMLLAGIVFGSTDERVLYATRTFFGVYRVSEDSQARYHGLAHGTTLHGMQSLDPSRRAEPLTYFHRTGPFGQAFPVLPHAMTAREVAVVGLGVGTLATYAQPAQHWTFYEIDPAIERIARTSAYFTFMDQCGDRCSVVIGDARLSLARARAGTYDLLVLDAFSSDSIPIHLMTREAVGLYLSRLAPGGALVMHISNRHLRLAPIVARVAASHGLTAYEQIDRQKDGWPEAKQQSHWIVMARTKSDLGALTTDGRWSPLVASSDAPLWTDDFSNILSVLSLR